MIECCFSRKMQNLNCFNCKGVSNPPDTFVVGLTESSWSNLASVVSGVFPLAGAVEALWSKMYAVKRASSTGGYLSSES